jgi:hypothetical protein
MFLLFRCLSLLWAASLVPMYLEMMENVPEEAFKLLQKKLAAGCSYSKDALPFLLPEIIRAQQLDLLDHVDENLWDEILTWNEYESLRNRLCFLLKLPSLNPIFVQDLKWIASSQSMKESPGNQLFVDVINAIYPLLNLKARLAVYTTCLGVFGALKDRFRRKFTNLHGQHHRLSLVKLWNLRIRNPHLGQEVKEIACLHPQFRYYAPWVFRSIMPKDILVIRPEHRLIFWTPRPLRYLLDTVTDIEVISNIMCLYPHNVLVNVDRKTFADAFRLTFLHRSLEMAITNWKHAPSWMIDFLGEHDYPKMFLKKLIEAPGKVVHADPSIYLKYLEGTDDTHWLIDHPKAFEDQPSTELVCSFFEQDISEDRAIRLLVDYLGDEVMRSFFSKRFSDKNVLEVLRNLHRSKMLKVSANVLVLANETGYCSCVIDLLYRNLM